MRRTVILMIALLLISSCSARVEYERTTAPHSAGALDINNASVDELEKLPHIGRKTGESIVRFRTENGPFRRVEHILLIRGLSESRFAELRPMLLIADE